MKKMNQESYINNVLQHVRFKEAHHEIERELASHIAEIKESYSGVIHDESQLQDQILNRMGNPEVTGQQLDQIHHPRIDWSLVALTGALLVTGFAMMSKLGFLASHSLWAAIGLIIAVGFVFLKPSYLQKWSPLGFAIVLFTAFLSFFSSTYSGGQPYISVGAINIKIIDLSAALFVLLAPGVLSFAKNNKIYSFLAYFGLSVPLLVFFKTGSAFPAAAYGIAILGILSIFSSSLIPSLPILASAVLGTFLWPKEGAQFVSAEILETIRQSEVHTDFVMTSIYNISSFASAIVAACAVLLCFRIFSNSRTIKSIHGKMLMTGIGCFLSVAVLWSLFANLGFTPMPSAGVNLPFVSYGGSMMISQLAMIGITIGYYRRKSIGDRIVDDLSV